MSAMSPFRDGAELDTQSLAEQEDWEGEPEQEEWQVPSALAEQGEAWQEADFEDLDLASAGEEEAEGEALEWPGLSAEELAAPAAIRAGRLEVQRVPLLAGHRGKPPDLLLRWNAMPAAPEEVDVVVHLHGHWHPGLQLPRDIEPVSGLDLIPVEGPSGQGRARPTLTVLPRGNDKGVKQRNGSLYVYDFPAFADPHAVVALQRLSLERFAAEVGISVPRIGRQILTAHSGGGQALMKILEHHDPDQVHVFDALYGDPEPLSRWASKRIDRDRAALRAPGAPSLRAYMPTRGGALRVFYQGQGTRSNSLKVLDAVSARRGADLKDWYRVEASTYDHFQIPRRYGWRVLADAAADVPAASAPTTGHHETEYESYEEEEARRPPLNDLPEPVSEASYEAFEQELEPELWGEEEDEADEDFLEAEEEVEGFEAAATTPAYEALAAAFEAADLAGEVPHAEAEEEGIESPEVERAEAEAFLENVYSRELAYEHEAPATVTFPSGASLQVVSGPTGKGEEHYDPHHTGNPLLDTSASVRSTALSTSLTVGELARSGGRAFDKARIDPELVRCLQRLHDHVGRPVHVVSGYRPFLYNVELYTKTYKKKPTQSRHSSGQAADVKIAGMTGMEIAKAAIDAGNSKLGLGIDGDNAHIDVRGGWAFWSYFKDKDRNERAVAEIRTYQRRKGAAGTAAPVTAPTGGTSPAAGLAGQMLEAVGRGLWDVAVRLAIDSGITDATQLTNTLFYLRHPDLRGKRIEPQQGDLAREWIEIRDRWVKPALGGHAASPAPAARSGVRLKRVKNGYAAYGGGRLEESLRRLVRAGTLSISERDIATLQRIADVESSGLTNALNSWDNAVMSIGFKQWTLRWGELQDLIGRAPEAFARHGIRLAPPGTSYAFGPRGKTWTKRAIDGVPDKETLRSEEWGRRFFLAALEPEAVAAAATKALEDVHKVEQHVRATYGWSPHFESARGRALLAELDNNRPAYVQIVVPRVVARAKERPGIDEEAFLAIFVEEIVAAYQAKEGDAAKGRRWTSKIMGR